MIDLSFHAGQVSVTEDRYEIPLGSTITINATSDTTEEIHVHGYNEYLDLVAGETSSLTFIADVAGIFEAELEGSGMFAFEIAVAP